MHVAVIGLGFGRAFAPIYQKHPSVDRVSLCDPDEVLLAKVSQELGLVDGYRSLDQVLADGSVDAVHLLTPLPLHAEQTVQVLKAGKHCACAVTMGMEIEELDRIAAEAKASGKRYMMMETGRFCREFFYARDMRDRGEFGKINFARGDYYQDLEAAYPAYWRETPPMKYSTHCLGPILELLETRAVSVSCVGVGRIRPDITTNPRCPFPMQVAHFKLADTDAIVQINRAWYQAAHGYVEAFSVFGEKRSFEWPQIESVEDPVIHELGPVQSEIRWREISTRRVPVPYRPDLLPKEIAEFAEGGHGGSHPHLVHEFVSSIVEDRPSVIDERVAADWTAAGICAHESSLRGGEWIEIPSFTP